MQTMQITITSPTSAELAAYKPASITIRIITPTQHPLSDALRTELCEILAGFFWVEPLEINGIITIGLDAVGNIPRFHEKIRLLLIHIHQTISTAIRFSVEFEY